MRQKLLYRNLLIRASPQAYLLCIFSVPGSVDKPRRRRIAYWYFHFGHSGRTISRRMMFAGGQCGQSRTSRPSSVDDTRNPESRDTHSRWTQPCYYRLTVQMLKFFVAHALAYLIVVIGDSTAAASGNVTLSETTSHRTHLEEWLKTTDARLTSINTPMTSLDDTHPAPRAALDTVVVYCSKRVGDVCGGECTVYNGSAACLFTPHTQCIWASKDVGFCDKKDCDGNCRTFSGCGTFLRDGFCLALGTRSIVVSPL